MMVAWLLYCNLSVMTLFEYTLPRDIAEGCGPQQGERQCGRGRPSRVTGRQHRAACRLGAAYCVPVCLHPLQHHLLVLPCQLTQ